MNHLLSTNFNWSNTEKLDSSSEISENYSEIELLLMAMNISLGHTTSVLKFLIKFVAH